MDKLFIHDPNGYMVEICNCEKLPGDCLLPTFISRFNVGLVHFNLKLGCLCSTELLICFSICIKYQNVFFESLKKYIQALLGNLLTV